MTNQDLELLQEYATHGSEPAFETLVSRHLSLVYSSALRQVRDPHLAEEITQAVFIILARKAGSLSPKTILPGWLYRTTRFTASNVLKIQARRHRREQDAFMQSNLEDTPTENLWQELSPLLDEVMAQLRSTDRDALVLRYFENKSLSEVGAALGLAERAAQKRVARGLEKLRGLLMKRGVALTTTLIAGAISANSLQATPAALAKSVTAMAIGKGAVVSSSTLTLIQGALKLMAWTKIKTTVVVGAVVLFAAAGTEIYKIHAATHRGPNYFPRASWTASGFATPEATIKSFMWAKSTGDYRTFLTVIIPEKRQEVENTYFKNKSDPAKSAALIANVKNIQGLQIQKKTFLADGQIVFQMHFDGMPESTYSIVTMKQVDGEWKASDVEEHQ